MRSAGGQTRWAKSYSIVDHQLLHGGFFHQLSHQALALYLFLVVVGDREGKSFYADPTIQSILHLNQVQLDQARDQLIQVDLIDYRKPNWYLKNLKPRDAQNKNAIRERAVTTHPISLKKILENLS